ncbi:Na+/H+ antiporter NhaC family protein [Alkalicoccus chagannorensis]|uniref:Na+/H+ antiporter NhaC family protein n=1 Tax=Alkalicoccus chagannorensis TaxID=427072 RepID=UPI00047BF62C
MYSLPQIMLVFTITLLPLMAAVFFGFPLPAAVLPGLALLLWMETRRGVKHRTLLHVVQTGLSRNRTIAWLLVFIGLMLPTWAAAGITEDLNLLFQHTLRPDFFFTSAFLITGAMSFAVGSAVGSLSIVGIPLMSAGLALALPAPVLAGALVSGAFVGDRTSPLSSSFQLMRFAVETSTSAHFRQIMPTLVLSGLITTAVYAAADAYFYTGAAAPSPSPLDPAAAAGSLAAPLLLLLLIAAGRSMYTCFLSGIAAGALLLIWRGVSTEVWLTYMLFGRDTLQGLLDMLPFVLFILLVGAFCQLIESSGMLQPLLSRFFPHNVSFTSASWRTVAAAGMISLLSPNQSFPILLTGRALQEWWHTHFHRRHLGRLLADSTVVFAGMVPWSLLAVLCAAIVGVPVIYYVPAAVFLWLTPFVTVAYSWLLARWTAARTNAAD